MIAQLTQVIDRIGFASAKVRFLFYLFLRLKVCHKSSLLLIKYAPITIPAFLNLRVTNASVLSK